MNSSLKDYDVLVVGGGATGSGVLLDAASRGLKVALVESDDIGSKTSSASSKLIHGGLRYLERGEVRLVAESLRERAILQKTASHLVKPLGFVIPVHSRSRLKGVSKLFGLSATLWGYDLAGSIRSSKAHRRLGVDETLKLLPTLQREDLVGSLLYHDAFADDSRLCLNVCITAQKHFGADIFTHTRVEGFTSPGASGYAEVNCLPDTSVGDGQPFTLRSRVVVLAGGLANGALSELARSNSGVGIVPAKGVHLAVHGSKLPLNSAGAIEVGDGRRIFVVPWGEYSYFGTTDTPFNGPVSAPDIDNSDVEYLLSAINARFSTKVSKADITGGWSGLRPLLKPDIDASDTTELSRKYEILTPTPWAIVVAGGKLTTYRAMAQSAVDLVCEKLDHQRNSMTSRINLVGSYPVSDRAQLTARVRSHLPSQLGSETLNSVTTHLIERYGAQAVSVIKTMGQDPSSYQALAGGDLVGEFEYQIKHELASSVSDLLMRRSRIAILDHSKAELELEAASDAIARYKELNTSQIEAQKTQFLSSIARLRVGNG
ncbi:MAG: glycerol-3-phosphate dehydrogenase/oxidase [Acidimicrobiaceae bacterium]|nr:glycerol-3-phosphate dehydrogenase/oxidase [Acidimicrobiaceae bacterium]